MAIIKAGYVQLDPVFGQKQENFRRAEELLETVRAGLLVFPELFATGYCFPSAEVLNYLAEDTRGETAGFLKRMSLKTGAAIVAGFAEREASGQIFNSAMLVSQGMVKGVYRKLHLFGDEKKWFIPGNLPLKVYSLRGFRVGMMICFDWMFPEVCRSLALKGAQIAAHPSNLVTPWAQGAMTTRCLENRIFAITANRVGYEELEGARLTFTGRSQVTAPDGTVLIQASDRSPVVCLAELDPDIADCKKIPSGNDVHADRRPEFY